jgi:hypothetical protein
MTPTNSTRTLTRMRLVPALLTVILLAASARAVSADMIQIGTFAWETITEDQDEFAVFCGAAPCSEFTLTNDLSTLTPEQLSEIGVSSPDALFEDIRSPGVDPFSHGSLSSAFSTLVWLSSNPIETASVLFTISGGLTGTLLFPTLTGPTGEPAGIFVDVASEPPPPTVPEPSTIGLVGTGLLIASLRRRAQARARA